MRRFYSLLLTAAFLLVGMNVLAGDHTLTSALQWDEAWQDVATNGGKITLNCDPTISTGKYYWLGTENMNDPAKSVEIDLNGHVMTFNGQFLLTHGTLKITGEGGEINGAMAANLFYVTGSTNKDVDPSVDGANYYTHLYIGEGVTVRQSSNYSAAIRIEEVYGGSAAQKAREATASVPTKKALTYATNIFVVPYMSGDKEIATGRNYQNKGVAYGVRVDVKGTVEGQKYGVQTGGYLGCKQYFDDKMANLDARFNPNNVELVTTKPFYAQVKDSKDAGSYAVDNIKNHVFGANDDATYSSFVHIYPTGVVKALENYTNSDGNPFGIYAGGYGRWKVEGYVTGNTGALVKSGIVDFENATVVGTGTTYAAANNSTSGSKASGSGIVISTEDSYVGETQVSIKGDSYVAADHGYALQEIITTQNGAGDSKVDAITIDGGTFAGGKVGEDPNTGKPIEGTITITEKTATGENTVTINGLSVTGTGSYITQEDDGVSIGGKTLEQYFSDLGTGIHITTVPDGDNTSTYVISKGDAPTPGNWVSKIDDTHPQIEGASVKWITNTVDAISGYLKLTELEINDFTDVQKTNPREQTLTIQSGATLEVGRVILGPEAHIIVKAGGKLIVTGTDGIIANQVNNIKLESSESAQAIFLFNPAVSSNRHPKATVQLTSKGYLDGTKKVWQRFGIPSYTTNTEADAGAVTRAAVEYDNENAASSFDRFDYAQDKWVVMKKADDEVFVPFQCYEVTSLATAPGTVYTFKCRLMGNESYTLPIYSEWNYYANSYMAPIDIKEMLSDMTVASKLDGTIYVYRSSDNWWDAVNQMDFSGFFGSSSAQTTIDPMQAFIFKSREGESDAVVNYKEHIYNPLVNPSAGVPARNREVSAGTAMIEIAAADGAKDVMYLVESDQFSAEYDNGYDASKYMNGESFNLFASVNDEKMAKVATDNLEGTVLGMNTKEQTSFTMTISHVNNINYAIRDNFTGTEIEMVEGATYMFSTAANANIEGRFEIVPVVKMPTAIENIEATAAAKGIYTVTGQFVGNDYHSLPNGIYVVDGKKIVK